MSLPSGAAAASSARRGDSCFCGIIAGTSEDPHESPHVLGKRDRVRAAGTCPGTKTAVLTEAWSLGGGRSARGGWGATRRCRFPRPTTAPADVRRSGRTPGQGCPPSCSQAGRPAQDRPRSRGSEETRGLTGAWGPGTEGRGNKACALVTNASWRVP